MGRGETQEKSGRRYPEKLMCRIWGQGSSRDRRKKIIGYMHRLVRSIELRKKS